MQRRLQAFLCGITLVAIVSLFLSYNKLVRSVESAATAAGIVDTDLAAA
jgi:hypothetical protein